MIECCTVHVIKWRKLATYTVQSWVVKKNALVIWARLFAVCFVVVVVVVFFL